MTEGGKRVTQRENFPVLSMCLCDLVRRASSTLPLITVFKSGREGRGWDCTINDYDVVQEYRINEKSLRRKLKNINLKSDF